MMEINPNAVKIGQHYFSTRRKAVKRLNTTYYSLEKALNSGIDFKSIEDAKKYFSSPRRGKREKVTVNGIEYSSKNEAARQLNISVTKLNTILKKSK